MTEKDVKSHLLGKHPKLPLGDDEVEMVLLTDGDYAGNYIYKRMPYTSMVNFYKDKLEFYNRMRKVFGLPSIQYL